MYQAEIRGKLSNENENKEDILTSNVFSFFKYADRKVFLLPFLHSIGLEVSLDEALQTEFLFWPSFPDRTEPDLVIITGSYYLLVEAKYQSGFGQATSIKKHQLVREIEGGSLEAGTLDKAFKILIITADYYAKPEIDQNIPPDHKKNYIWINWQTIALLIFGILEQHPKISCETKLFADDLYHLLIKKNLRNYEGKQVLSQIHPLSNFHDPIFFQANTARYRGDFLGFIQALETLPQISPPPTNLFFSTQKLFKFNGFRTEMIVTNKENIFFKGR